MTARRRPRPLVTALAIAAACVPLAAGCSPLPGGEAGGEKPITVMTWAPDRTTATNQPGMPAMARAYARWVNAAGGIDGRPLKVLTCNERNDPMGAARCAERAREREAVAVVGSYSQHGHSFMPTLETAGIPYIGGYGLADEEFTSPLSYPVNGGQPALLAGNGRQLDKSCDQVSLVRPDTITGDRMARLFRAGLTSTGSQRLTDVLAPEDATDYTEHAQRALAGVDVGEDDALAAGDTADGSCVSAVLSGRTNTFFDSFRRLQADRPKVLIASIHGSVRQSLIDSTGGTGSPLDGAYATGWYPVSSDARWDRMKKVVTTHAFGDNRIDTADPGVQTTWIAYTVLRSVLGSMDAESITPRTVQRALDRGGPIDTGGLTPPLSWRYEDMLATTDYPRLVNPMVTYQRVRDGRLVAVRDDFVDIAETLEQGELS